MRALERIAVVAVGLALSAVALISSARESSAAGPLIGVVRKATGGQADAATVRAILLEKLGTQ